MSTGALPGRFQSRTELAWPLEQQLGFADEALAPGGAHSLDAWGLADVSEEGAALRALKCWRSA